MQPSLFETHEPYTDLVPAPDPQLRALVLVESGLPRLRLDAFLLDQLNQFGVRDMHSLPLGQAKLELVHRLRQAADRGIGLALLGLRAGRDMADLAGALQLQLPQAAERARASRASKTPPPLLERAVVGLKNGMLVAAVPGPTAGIRKALGALYPELFRYLEVMAQTRGIWAYAA